MSTTDRGVAGPAGGPPATATAAEEIRAVPVRHPGRWVSAAAVLLLAAWLLLSALESGFADWGAVGRYLSNDLILTGLVNTVVLSVTAQALGIALGLVLAIMRQSPNPVLSVTSWLYIWFFRGTPVLVQLIFWFNLALVYRNVTLAIPFADVTFFSVPMNQVMTPFVAALLGLGLNEAAYMAEVVRAGLLSVDEGQRDAAHALGMTRGQTLRRIVLPQAMRVIIPPTGNQFISMLKTSSLASVITFEELTRRAQDIYAANFLVIDLLIVASIWYLVLTSVASVGQYYLERRYARGTARALAETPLARVRRNLAPVVRRRPR